MLLNRPLKLMVTAILSASVSAPVIAHSATKHQSASQSAVSQTLRFNISAGALDQVLNTFAHQAGLNLAINGALTKGKHSGGLKGAMTVEQGLTEILKSSGLNYRFTDNQTVTLEAGQASATRLDAVVVKGEKISRSLSDTASSVMVFDNIEQDDTLSSGNDIVASVPNVISTEGTNYAPSIRGVDGTGPARGAMAFFAGSRTRMGLLIDGRPAEFNELVFGDAPLWDVEQVEVFRGPQSTLNGRNAIAGAMVVTTKNPTFENEGAVKVTAGSLDNRQIAAMYSAPLSDDWAFRVAAEKKARDSYLDYEAYEGVPKAGEYHSSLIRAKFLYEPQDNAGVSHLITLSHHDYLGPQAEGVVRPFEDKQPDSVHPAEFNPRNTSAGLESSWKLNNTFTLENTLIYADSDVERSVPTVGRGNATIETKSLLIEPRVKFATDQQDGFVGLHFYDADQDEFIDIRNSYYDDSTRNIAIFGETRVDLSNTVELTVGGRWEKETRKRSGGNAPFTVALDESYTAFSPKAALNIQANDEWSVGALVSRGFNGGGAGVTFEPPFVSYSYKPEYVWNYEAFARGELLDGRLMLNANVFYSDYKDMQIPLNLNANSIIIHNVKESRSYGLELGARWLPVPELKLFADVGLLSTEITDDSDSGFKGNELARAPSLSSNLGFVYDQGNGFEIGGNAYYSHAYYSDVNNTERAEIDPFWVANMHASYTMGDYRVFAFVKNLTDTDQVTFYRSVADTAEDDLVAMQPSRTWGIGAEFNF